MLPLAYLEIVEFRDLDEQRASFLLAASAVILVSWGLIRLKKWLGTVALIGALVSGLLIISEVRWTKGWHFPNTPVHLPLMYLVTAYLSAVLPVFAVIALLMARKNRANQRPDGTSAKAPPSNPSQGAAVPHP
jgi:cell division protein FtsW (lipid II flippase)